MWRELAPAVLAAKQRAGSWSALSKQTGIPVRTLQRIARGGVHVRDETLLGLERAGIIPPLEQVEGFEDYVREKLGRIEGILGDLYLTTLGFTPPALEESLAAWSGERPPSVDDLLALRREIRERRSS